ncbi:MAG TPA: HAMP domain-containing protein [Sporichthyaceae bacterium]|nr:HAMP domain-containing protein [Sporichthyaceae bacterium]
MVASAGGIVIGNWASQRLVQPLNQIASAVTSLAEGRFETRLSPTEDADLDRIVEAFNTMASALKQRIDRDARFAADVSHELRSPLTTLVAAVDVLSHRRPELSERAQRAGPDNR